MAMRILLVFVFLALLTQAVSGSVSIHVMVVGNKALEVQENRQLTFGSTSFKDAKLSPDGKSICYLAYGANETMDLCLLKSTGGKSTTVLSGPRLSAWRKATDTKTGWCIGGPVVWSPNSKMLAFPAERVLAEGEGVTRSRYILVLSDKGEHLHSLELPDLEEIRVDCDDLAWSPDSTRIAASYFSLADELAKGVIVLGLDGRSTFHSPDGFQRFEGWDAVDQSLVVLVESDNAWDHLKFRADGQTEVAYEHSTLSPDGTFRILHGQGRFDVQDMHSGRSWTVVSPVANSFLSWLPNSRMFIYRVDHVLRDEMHDRQEILRGVWLASVASTRLNTMCVCLDHNSSIRPTWSDDCRRMVYVYRNALYAAELVWREPTTRQKMSAGLQLSEEEEKEAIQNNGKELGIAIQMYSFDWDNQLPPAENVIEELRSYTKNNDVFFRPGTEDVVFRYVSPEVEKFHEIEFPSDTVIAILDPGVYDWVVHVYADSHVEVVPRQ